MRFDSDAVFGTLNENVLVYFDCFVGILLVWFINIMVFLIKKFGG